ncbi:MAG: hypothetical protein BV457_09365 [Thermoplasmata archaeon M9B1D]|nr:MAG: hypothetical protein BV457_09365 [Thermoplasmata archaeon M9B1D]PNX51048.1 MAG: hypothetical protein BV456_04665 [Thermoplasmata archaeon M8B2D]
MNNVTAMSVVTLVFAVLGLIVWVYWAIKFKEVWLYAIPPISWILDVIFLILIKFFSGNLEFFHFWSTVVRLHGVILITSGVFTGLIGYSRYKAQKEKIIEEKY